jgi:hypothetical protein
MPIGLFVGMVTVLSGFFEAELYRLRGEMWEAATEPTPLAASRRRLLSLVGGIGRAGVFG